MASHMQVHLRPLSLPDQSEQRAIEELVRAILLDPRVVAFKSMDARKDFIEQLAWQIL